MTAFASAAIKDAFRLRAGQLAALVLTAAALLLLLALGTYNPHDPSLNTATSRAATNAAGLAGATVADVLLQGFGAAAALAPMAMLAWARRLWSGRPLRFSIRLIATLIALPALGALLSAIPGPHGPLAWPTAAGPGGGPTLTTP